jgi:tetratricopeptide (TPR) repeat protein
MIRPLDEAIAHHRAGRLDAAEHGYRSLLRAAPDDPDALHLLGVTLGQRDRLDEALRLIDQAIARRPRVAAYHGNRGEVLRKLGKHQEALGALETALELDPALASAHNNLGMIRLQAGDAEQALASFDEAIRLRGDFAIAQVNRADALRALGHLDEAAEAYRQALRFDPDNSWVHTHLGRVLVERGDIDLLDAALLHCQRACALAPGLGQAQTNLGSVWAAMGRLDDALACYRRALALDPTLSLPWNNIARVEQQLGRYDAAEAAYEQALALEPRAARFHANLATLLAEQDRDDEAAARYRVAVDCNPNHAESYRGMAMGLERGLERFDAMYLGPNPAPWDIPVPQPAFVALEEAGAIQGSVLDVGCGSGENALYLAARGHKVWGIDYAPHAIAQALKKAEQRGLPVRFQVANALELDKLGRQFDGVIDCGLFHSFRPEEHPAYTAMLAKVVRPGGRVHLLCFSDREPPGPGPRRVTRWQIHDAFRTGWRIERITESAFKTTRYPGAPQFSPGGPRAWLATIVR